MFDLARGDVRVRCPATHRVRPLGRQERALPDDGTGVDAVVSAALVGCLERTGFAVLDGFELLPAPLTPTDDPDAERTFATGSEAAPAASTQLAAEPAVLAVDVEVAAGHDAVVLVEQDGWYSWHLPMPRTSKLSARPGARTAAFEIPLTPGEGPAAGSAGRARPPLRGDTEAAPLRGDTETAPQGGAVEVRRLLAPALQGPARLRVLDFPAPPLAGDAITFLERGADRGLVRLDDADPARWSRADRLEKVLAPTGAPARVLLVVHGTFTNTVGTFGALGLTSFGRAFLGRALRAYDAVVGFDHPTLSVDPLANATDLLARVQGVTRPVTVDIVCHSRGGLTVRSFVEQVLPVSGWNGRAGRIVYVGAPNGGTILADPQRWGDLANLFTTLTAASAQALGRLGAESVAALVDAAARGLGAFVQYLAAYVRSPGGVPGLAAMVPGGAFVTELNRTQPGQPPPGTPWYVVSSDFSADLRRQRPFELPWQLSLSVADGVLDAVFQGPNDLAVDVPSMSAIDLEAGDYVADQLAFGGDDGVHHLGYVVQERFVAALHRWLLDPLERTP